jgi:hypothetical protein
MIAPGYRVLVMTEPEYQNLKRLVNAKLDDDGRDGWLEIATNIVAHVNACVYQVPASKPVQIIRQEQERTTRRNANPSK